MTRLKSIIRIQGLCRAIESRGGFATIVKKGHDDAGRFLISLRRESGFALFSPAPSLSTKMKFDRSVLNECDMTDRLAWESDIDPDLWLIEVEGLCEDEFQLLLFQML